MRFQRWIPYSIRETSLRFASVSLGLVWCAFAIPVHAGEFDEAVWDWRAGDLIFRSGIDPLDDLVAASTGARFGSVAILRASSGGPRVVYVDPEIGVTEVMLDEFVSGLDQSDYTAYRVTGAGSWGQGDSPISYNALSSPMANQPTCIGFRGVMRITARNWCTSLP